jgi:hypothetical protein
MFLRECEKRGLRDQALEDAKPLAFADEFLTCFPQELVEQCAVIL